MRRAMLCRTVQSRGVSIQCSRSGEFTHFPPHDESVGKYLIQNLEEKEEIGTLIEAGLSKLEVLYVFKQESIGFLNLLHSLLLSCPEGYTGTDLLCDLLRFGHEKKLHGKTFEELKREFVSSRIEHLECLLNILAQIDRETGAEKICTNKFQSLILEILPSLKQHSWM